MDSHLISFKPLHRNDFPLLHTWLNVDFVTKWYEKRKFTYDDVEIKFAPRVNHEVPTESFIIQYDKKSIGYIQTYRVHDYPEYALCVLVDRNTAGMDLFIGERDYIGKGLGKDIIQEFLNTIVFKKDNINKCIVGPEPENKAAIRVYEKAGFTYLKTVQCEGEKEPEYIMMIRKEPTEQVVYKRVKLRAT